MSRGWCNVHYQRWYHYGDPLAKVRVKGDNLRRFFSHVDKGEGDGCWTWNTQVNPRTGYAVFREGDRFSRMRLAHRWSYEQFVGPIPEGLVIDHLCRVRHCVNPAHLEAVTPGENVRRAAARITHCPHGHPYDAANTRLVRRPNGGVNRICRACRRADVQRRREAMRLRSGL